MASRGMPGGEPRNNIMNPRWGRLTVAYLVFCLVGLGVLRWIGLSWAAIGGCAVVLVVALALHMWRWKKGLDEWAAEDSDGHSFER